MYISITTTIMFYIMSFLLRTSSTKIKILSQVKTSLHLAVLSASVSYIFQFCIFYGSMTELSNSTNCCLFKDNSNHFSLSL